MKYMFIILVGISLVLVGCATKVKEEPPIDDVGVLECPEPRIPYSGAIELLNDGKVSIISQSHSRCVTVELKNGTTYYTVEAKLDDIFDDFRECGFACRDTGLGTE